MYYFMTQVFFKAWKRGNMIVILEYISNLQKIATAGKDLFWFTQVKNVIVFVHFKGACAPNPCIGNITCEERVGGFVCICRPGLVYLEMRGCIQSMTGSVLNHRNIIVDM